ncbi:error-prone DNA polymerase [Amycolatopsis lurida]|uniref:Error-prone DNA polymerase n=1 Tax=Amycolatopsis lurida NRRL 2430 TaxID=1460371 RepID=A0A2P2FYP3_AMYLU|nr:OB-fold nucleic acid binding domain-containing protein [Amycolatopsis lurida]KFU81837.1 hypothetical protein BB31_08285 [Amycolatopsis lurida NRRL 2430]SEB32531.1 error-prone DNA polymerase [Amycolatopsis lurida]
MVALETRWVGSLVALTPSERTKLGEWFPHLQRGPVGARQGHLSFALLVYASAYVKCYYPAAFAGLASASRDTHLPGIASGLDAPALPGMTALEITTTDLRATGISPDEHPMQYLREYLDGRGALTAAAVTGAGNGATVWVTGAVTHLQRPATAGGITFLNLEDETGMLNIVVTQRLWNREHKVVRNSPALLVHGVIQSHHGVTSLAADHFESLDLRGLATTSRDFR